MPSFMTISLLILYAPALSHQTPELRLQRDLKKTKSDESASENRDRRKPLDIDLSALRQFF